MVRIQRILEAKISNQEKVDKLLQYDCEIRTELGTDSSLEEIQDAEWYSGQIIDEVIKLDPELKYLKND